MAKKRPYLTALGLRRHIAFREKMQPLLDSLEIRDRNVAYYILMWQSARFVSIESLDDMYEEACGILNLLIKKGGK